MRFAVDYKPEPGVGAQLTVDCDRWWDARHVALLHFRCEPDQLVFESIESMPDIEVDVWTRWVGTDSNSDRKRMEFRGPKHRGIKDRQWKWRPIEEYNAT